MNKKERFITVSRAQIGEYTAFCNYLNTLLEVAERFDGKVLNVRFKKAIDEACEKVFRPGSNMYVPRFPVTTSVDLYEKTRERVRVKFSRLRFQFYVTNRWVSLDTDKNGVPTGTYIDNGMYLDFFADEGVTSENRICAQAIRDAVVEKIVAIREEVAVLIDAVEKYDYYEKVVGDLRAAIGESVVGINPLLRPKELTAFATLEQLKEGRKAIVNKVCGTTKEDSTIRVSEG
jgi:hypothetical protein